MTWEEPPGYGAQQGAKDMGWGWGGRSEGPPALRKAIHLLLPPPAQGPWKDEKSCGPWSLPSP